MQSEQLIEAKKYLKNLYDELISIKQSYGTTRLSELFEKKEQAMLIALELLESHLSASEDLPERKADSNCDCEDGYCGCQDEVEGFNSCLDQVTPILARLKEELASRDAKIAELEWIYGVAIKDAKSFQDRIASLEKEVGEKCKYSTISHGIGIDGKVTEIKLHCTMNPENGYTDSIHALIERKGKGGSEQ